MLGVNIVMILLVAIVASACLTPLQMIMIANLKSTAVIKGLWAVDFLLFLSIFSAIWLRG